ncbi:receptor kinase-like protein Xa21 [Camellia sinensis]|uniref:receptor kinase-like protein Xa21 n=1 Tax=Camellia sinensis TaxID=4442 RepID=UPI00103617D5|nr:receptor kinase-like protein Xa21 [Camellia sinensis]
MAKDNPQKGMKGEMDFALCDSQERKDDYFANTVTAAAVLVNSDHHGNETDRLAQLEFKAKITSDPNRALKLGNLPRFEFLWLDNNSISGEIPVSACFKLYFLSLTNNSLVGKIPEELSSLPELEQIFVDRNNLKGDLPSSLGNLSILHSFVAAENSISGSIPNSLGRLTNLKSLALGVNRLFGTLPSLIFNISSIRQFDLADNLIQGSLP